MRVISRDKLKRKLERADDFVLVEVSPPEDYEQQHLPMALNVPLDQDFDETIQQVLPNKQQCVVVYGGNSQRNEATMAAQRLEALGYQDVMSFPPGKSDWRHAGLHVEHSRHL